MERIISAAFLLGLMCLLTIGAGIFVLVVNSLAAHYPRLKETAIVATVIGGLAALFFCIYGVSVSVQILGTLG